MAPEEPLAAPKLGVLAGAGELPLRIIEACRAADRTFFVLAFEGSADPAVVQGVPHAWIRLGAAGEGLRILRANGVAELVMAGGVKRPSVLQLRPDWRTAKFFARIGYRALGDDGLMKAVIHELEQVEGFRVVGLDTILGTSLAPEGPIGRNAPDEQARQDIAHGFRIVRALGALDIGQAVVVQQGLVLGVEAIEGTDALIARCAALKRDGPGGVLVKGMKPGQERRVDLPTIGPRTVTSAAAAGLRGVAVEAASSILVDRAAIAAAADHAGLFVVGVVPP
jgi:UDP-2,3-diacylglucosamine hydrolase